MIPQWKVDVPRICTNRSPAGILAATALASLPKHRTWPPTSSPLIFSITQTLSLRSPILVPATSKKSSIDSIPEAVPHKHSSRTITCITGEKYAAISPLTHSVSVF